MAFYYSPKIATDGLVLCLDAANNLSYPGSGVIWNDLSGQANNGVLTNGPTYSTNNGGGIVFDGTDDYAVAGSSNITVNQPKSVFCWIYNTTANTSISFTRLFNYMPNGTDRFVLTIDRYNRSAGVFGIGGTPNNNGVYGVTTASFPLSTWCNVGFTFDGSTFMMYHNSVAYSPSDSSAGSLGFSGVSGLILGARTAVPATFYSGTISNVQLYNRALSAQEISQNYNALKNRFGL